MQRNCIVPYGLDKKAALKQKIKIFFLTFLSVDFSNLIFDCMNAKHRDCKIN